MARRMSLAAMLGLTLLASSSITSFAAPRSCPNVTGGEVIFANNVSCVNARRMARAWVKRYRRDGRYNRRVHGFRCRVTSDSIEGATMRCRRGKQTVRFYPNVPR
jgi:hypothetical protein